MQFGLPVCNKGKTWCKQPISAWQPAIADRQYALLKAKNMGIGLQYLNQNLSKICARELPDLCKLLEARAVIAGVMVEKWSKKHSATGYLALKTKS